MLADEIAITIPSSKTDQQGLGWTRNHFASDSEICPVKWMAWWFKRTADVPEFEPVFSFPKDSSNISAGLDFITRRRVSKVLSAAAGELGYPQGSVSSHSCRSGGCTALIHAGVPPSVCQVIGRWSSDIFKIYSRFTAGLMHDVARMMSGAAVAPPNEYNLGNGAEVTPPVIGSTTASSPIQAYLAH